MVTRTEQEIAAERWKDQSENAIGAAFRIWGAGVAAEYRPGSQSISDERQIALNVMMQGQLTRGASRVFGFDMRLYKDLEQDIREIAARQMDAEIAREIEAAVPSIVRTVNKFLLSANAVMVSEGGNLTGARRSLGNLLRNHSLVVATTESQWVTETARKTFVTAVKDPLGNTIEQIVALIESGDINGAVRLSREVAKLATAPTSVVQGEIVNTINNAIPDLFEPIVQGEAVANLRRQAEALNSEGKEWLTVGDANVRASHDAANGQERPIEQPFVLDDGSQLQYPGDGSLGASLGQIVNCRCATLYG